MGAHAPQHEVNSYKILRSVRERYGDGAIF
jgi:hypothetical protein